MNHLLSRLFALLVVSVLFFISNVALAQTDKQKKSETIVIKSSIQCGMCQKSINAALGEVKGFKEAGFNLEKQTITVIYNPQKASPEALKKAIAETGYDADEVKADENAYKKLPQCCKKSS